MKKYMYKILIMVCVLAGMLTFPTVSVYAASASVSVSSASAASGSEVSVTVSVSGDENVAMVDLWLTYDTSVLEYVSGADVGGGGSIRLLSTDNTSFTIKFKAVNAGSAAISVNTSQSIVSSLYTDKMSISASSGTVTVKAPSTYSSNNNLSSLSISPGTLTPAFSKDVTTYNASVDSSCTRLIVSANAEDSKATISIWGAALDPGDNTTKITVTAENGTKKVYTIYTKRAYEQTTQPQSQASEEKPSEEVTQTPPSDVVINIDGTDYFIVSNFDESILPEGYEAVDYDYKGTKIVAAKGLSNGLTIFYLETAQDENSQKQFYIYDEQNDSFEILQRLNSRAVEYTIIKDGVTEGPKGYYSTKLELNGEQIMVWVENTAQPGYFLFYGMNVNGDKGWYQYDLGENTIQKAFFVNDNTGETESQTESADNSSNPTSATVGDESDISSVKEKYEEYALRMKLIVIILSVLLAAVIVVLVLFIAKSVKKEVKNDISDEIDIHDEDDIISLDDIDGIDDFSDEKDDLDDDDDFTFIDIE